MKNSYVVTLAEILRLIIIAITTISTILTLICVRYTLVSLPYHKALANFRASATIQEFKESVEDLSSFANSHNITKFNGDYSEALVVTDYLKKIEASDSDRIMSELRDTKKILEQKRCFNIDASVSAINKELGAPWCASDFYIIAIVWLVTIFIVVILKGIETCDFAYKPLFRIGGKQETAKTTKQ